MIKKLAVLILLFIFTLIPVHTALAAPLVDDPSVWLPKITGWAQPTPGQDFLRDRVVPFAVTGALSLLVILSFVFLLIGGLKLTMSGGTKDGAAKAKQTITYALIGLVLGLGVFLILGIIQFLLHTPAFGLPIPKCSSISPAAGFVSTGPCY